MYVNTRTYTYTYLFVDELMMVAGTFEECFLSPFFFFPFLFNLVLREEAETDVTSEGGSVKEDDNDWGCNKKVCALMTMSNLLL